MSNDNEVDILHRISRITEHYDSTLPTLDLITQVLENLQPLFKPENEVFFSTLQCFFRREHNRLKRQENIPSIFNVNTMWKEPLRQLKEILLFLVSSQTMAGNEPAASILNIFGNRFTIETIRDDANVFPLGEISYSEEYKTLTIHVPDLFEEKLSTTFYSFVDSELAQKMSPPGEGPFLVDGYLVENILHKMISVPEFADFATFVEKYLKSNNIKRVNEHLINRFFALKERLSFTFPKNKVSLFCQTIILHSLFKSSRYSYHLIVLKNQNNMIPAYYGSILFNSNKPFPLERINVFHIGLNLALSAINESLALEKEKKRDIPQVKAEATADGFLGMVGQSEAICRVFDKIKKVARFETDVLILGESGTGKDLAARAIHALSSKNKGPFIPVSLSDRPDSLIDSELFGHEKGAFTGAIHQKKGYLERAEGGTLFLDEISHIPSTVQAKLLRVFQSRSFERVGGASALDVDLRIICATSEDLGNKEIRENLEFLDPLYYRLEQFVISIPPLRKRKEDIPLLANFFLGKLNRQGEVKISDEAKDFIVSLDWPGNIRQLFAALRRAYIEAYDEGLIEPRHFEREYKKSEQKQQSLNRNLKTTLTYLRENGFVLDSALKEMNRNAFKISRKTLIRYTRELCLWFLAVNDWDLHRAVSNMAGKADLERYAAQRFRSYFIGDNRCNGILPIISNNHTDKEQEAFFKEIVHRDFHGHLLALKGKVVSREISYLTWKYILTHYA